MLNLGNKYLSPVPPVNSKTTPEMSGFDWTGPFDRRDAWVWTWYEGAAVGAEAGVRTAGAGDGAGL